MVAYADERDVYAYAMRAPAFVPSPQVVAAIDLTANTFTLSGHDLADGDELRFSLEGDAILGGTATSLPAPLSASTLYYAIAVGSDMFQVATSVGGSAVNLTVAGVGALAIVVSPVPVLRRLCEHWSRNVDGAATAHSGELVVVPNEVVGVVARSAGRDAVRVLGLNSPAYETDRKDLFDMRAFDEARLADWRRGTPIKGAVDQTTTPDNGARFEVLGGLGAFDSEDGTV